MEAPLLQQRLEKPLRIGFILFVRAREDLFSIVAEPFAFDEGTGTYVLIEVKFVLPLGWGQVRAGLNEQRKIGVLTSGKAAQLANAASLAHRLLEAAARRADVMHEAEYIEKVGLPGSAGTCQENPATQFDIRLEKIAPVLHR